MKNLNKVVGDKITLSKIIKNRVIPLIIFSFVFILGFRLASGMGWGEEIFLKNLTSELTIPTLPDITVDSRNYAHIVFYDGYSVDNYIQYLRIAEDGSIMVNKNLSYNSSTESRNVIDSNDSLHIALEGFNNTAGSTRFIKYINLCHER